MMGIAELRQEFETLARFFYEHDEGFEPWDEVEISNTFHVEETNETSIVLKNKQGVVVLIEDEPEILYQITKDPTVQNIVELSTAKAAKFSFAWFFVTLYDPESWSVNVQAD